MITKKHIGARLKSLQAMPRLLLALMGVVLVLLSVSNLSLSLFGRRTGADVSVRRVGGSNGGRNDISYQWSVSWIFELDGKKYEGHGTRQGSPSGVSVSKWVLYLPFMPWINNLEDATKPSFLNIVPLTLGILLLAVSCRRSAIKRRAGKIPSRTSDEAMDYDDSVEERFYDQRR